MILVRISWMLLEVAGLLSRDDHRFVPMTNCVPLQSEHHCLRVFE